MSADAALPDRLIAAALELLRNQPAEELSVRQVAQRVGVSHQAPYVHFGDRRRFLAAVAGAGLEVAAAEAQARVRSAGPDPVVRLRALVWAYLAFVDERPHVHDLAYGPLVSMRDHPRLQAAALAYWNLLRDTVAANQPSVAANQPNGVLEAEVLRRAATAWGTVYGIARLDAAGKIPRTVRADRSQLIDDAIHVLLEGWRADAAIPPASAAEPGTAAMSDQSRASPGSP